jgi:purine-binding chemotaxis protein CheW
VYGVDLARVAAVSMIRAMTPLPGVPRALAGLLNVRGRNVTAVDLGLFFGGHAGERRIVDAGKAITVGLDAREVAFIAEDLDGIRELFPGDLRAVSGAAASDPVKSVTPDGVHVLDLAAVFQDPRLAARTGGARGSR